MPERDPETGHSSRLLRGLIWAGVLLAPVAAAVVLLGQSSASVRFAVLLVAVSVVLIGASVLIRSDPVLQRAHIEDRVAEEVESLRADLRAEFRRGGPAPVTQSDNSGFFGDAPMMAPDDDPFPAAPRRAPAPAFAGDGRAAVPTPDSGFAIPGRVAAAAGGPGFGSGGRAAVPAPDGAGGRAAVQAADPGFGSGGRGADPGFGSGGRAAVPSPDSGFGNGGRAAVSGGRREPGAISGGRREPGAVSGGGREPGTVSGDRREPGGGRREPGVTSGARPAAAAGAGPIPQPRGAAAVRPGGTQYGRAEMLDGDFGASNGYSESAPNGYPARGGTYGSAAGEYGSASAAGPAYDQPAYDQAAYDQPAYDEPPYGQPAGYGSGEYGSGDYGYARPGDGYGPSNGYDDYRPGNGSGRVSPGGYGPVDDGYGGYSSPHADPDASGYGLDGGYDGSEPGGDPNYKARRHRPSANDTNVGTMADFASYGGWSDEPQPDERYVQGYGPRRR
ncbi:hypothetical protein [Paractinoplanes globisporus]|uniref:Uncharacterized protein n=1 Tax=Paractinoplanes globisporus TaxID=113565 RepID=A0ABW6WS97_9ACTN|nr:hypothetical protein [Actinoplanes globisporus]